MDNKAWSAAIQKLAGQNSGGTFFGFSPWAILTGVIFSIIGLLYVRRGKQEADILTVSAGAALIVFPYFVPNTLDMILTGAAIMGLHYMAHKYW